MGITTVMEHLLIWSAIVIVSAIALVGMIVVGATLLQAWSDWLEREERE